MDNPATHLSRRDFLNKTALSLASIGLFGLSSSAQSTAVQASSQTAQALLPDGSYQTPPLPYAYEALEPWIDAETMRLHHDIHFASYTKGLNEALQALQKARQHNDFSLLSYWENQLAFHGSGYILHTLFFNQLTQPGKSQPTAALQALLASSFGDFNSFKAQFNAAALQVQGSGWSILGYEPLGQKLVILQAEKHQNLTQWGIMPLLALDVWEHAYYLKYQNRRADYIQAFWQIVDFQSLEQRLQASISPFN